MIEWTGKKRGSSEEAGEASRLDVGMPALKQGSGLARTPRRPTVQDSGIECEGRQRSQGWSTPGLWPGWLDSYCCLQLRQGTHEDKQQIGEEDEELKFEIAKNEILEGRPGGGAQEAGHQLEKSRA